MHILKEKLTNSETHMHAVRHATNIQQVILQYAYAGYFKGTKNSKSNQKFYVIQRTLVPCSTEMNIYFTASDIKDIMINHK